MIIYRRNKKSIGAYNGWLVHCNSRNLRKKYIEDAKKKEDCR